MKFVMFLLRCGDSARLLSDDLQRWTRRQHDQQVPELCVHVFADRRAGFPSVRARLLPTRELSA